MLVYCIPLGAGRNRGHLQLWRFGSCLALVGQGKVPAEEYAGDDVLFPCVQKTAR